MKALARYFISKNASVMMASEYMLKVRDNDCFFQSYALSLRGRGSFSKYHCIFNNLYIQDDALIYVHPLAYFPARLFESIKSNDINISHNYLNYIIFIALTTFRNSQKNNKQLFFYRALQMMAYQI